MPASRVRIPPSPLGGPTGPPARRGGRAVECGGLENRYGSLGSSRVQIPPSPLHKPPRGSGQKQKGRPRSRPGTRSRSDPVSSGVQRGRFALAADLKAPDCFDEVLVIHGRRRLALACPRHRRQRGFLRERFETGGRKKAGCGGGGPQKKAPPGGPGPGGGPHFER